MLEEVEKWNRLNLIFDTRAHLHGHFRNYFTFFFVSKFHHNITLLIKKKNAWLVNQHGEYYIKIEMNAFILVTVNDSNEIYEIF